ncbi:MAG: methionine--tRNA ligase [Thermoanaerobaculia bacterium]|nr:methionine--tRNA ligase [Thermoanaerobaculia bacterium]
MSKPFYITTAIHYVNDVPHIGHIYENVTADVIARYRRMNGDDVYFLTGTDEHGQKIERTAAKKGISPIELADQVVAAHHANNARLQISNDDFIRTTQSRHRDGVYEIIRRIREKNPDDIYHGEHSGWYCQSEETFVPESQVTDGKCQDGHPVEMTTERNYFFRLSKYEKPLLDFYRANPEFVKPKGRFNEVISFVEAGLRDLSVSRTAIKWGIPFPGDEEHIIYVWLDALTNYISALGFGSADLSRYDKYWPADIHLIGKDIVRFHAVYWPAFLMAAGLPLPKSIVSHGFWLRDNVKISKSLGNVVRPDEVIDRYGAEAFRYYLSREMVFGQDSNYSDESFFTRYNAELANGIGNTISRASKMCETYFEGKTPPLSCDDNELKRAAEETIPVWTREMDQFAFQRALEAVWKFLDAVNGYIVSREPWRMFKENGADDALSRVLWNSLESLRLAWTMVAPFMPSLSAEALRRIGAGSEPPRVELLKWGLLPTNEPLVTGDALFPRIDFQTYVAETKNEGATVSEPIQDKKEEAQPAAPAATAVAAPAAEAVAETAKITIDDFFRADLRVAQILEAENVPKSKKLIRMKVTTGDSERQIVAGIATKYTPEELVGRKVVIVANLQPAKLMGIESNGMVLAASIDGEPSLVAVDQNVPNGTKVK